MEKKRIWELDFFRGVCIAGVVIVHVIFDLRFFAGMTIETPLFFDWIQHYGGLLFVILSGICVTLGHHSVRRGLIVFGCGMAITAVTYLVTDTANMVWFGILHLLGICMLIYPLIRKLPNAVLLPAGFLIIVLGYWFETLTVSVKWLFPLGLLDPSFGSGDFFPLFPCLGFFMIGIFLGRTVYQKQESLFPKVNTSNPFIRAFSFLGRHSLWVYLIHQPVVYGLILLFTD